jgi:hypothetical protein
MGPSSTNSGLRRLGRVLTVGALLLLSAAGAGAASASTTVRHPEPAARAWVAHEVRGLLAHNPGSRQISSNSIRTRSGAVITAVVPHTVSGRCHNGYLCLFWDTNFKGDQLTLGPYNDCYYYDLRYDYGSNGDTWANEASSIDNPNPRPAKAILQANHRQAYYLNPGNYLRDLTKDKAFNGHTMNDYISEVWTC